MAKILLVEDEQYTRELYASLLKEAGYEVDTAEDGEKGFSMAMKEGYDLILLDIILPKKDGVTFLKDLRRLDPKRRNRKVVMLTVLERDEFIKSALKSGADGYLIKSALKPDQVLSEIKSFLE